MRILIEGEYYNIDLLKELLGGKFYLSKGEKGLIDHVGYLHSNSNEIIYLLPKVFVDRYGMLLSLYSTTFLAENKLENILITKSDYNWTNYLLVIFYKSLSEFKRRYYDTSIIENEKAISLDTTLGDEEYSFLDLILSLVNFHKKNKTLITFKRKEQKSKKNRNVNWNNTVQKNIPFFTENNVPLYFDTINHCKIKDSEEILLTIYFSVLNYINLTYNFNIPIDTSFNLFKGKAFTQLLEKGLKQLKVIKHNYFSDSFLQLYKLLELFFSKSSQAKSKRDLNEFIMVRNYELVFEDMIDRLFSDDPSSLESSSNVSLKMLKEQKDGKIVDHLFEHNALIDTDENIYYIGDSKYYKSANTIGQHSIYKQFTYAKNVIQFNIDLLNDNKRINNKLRYRDSITEGYNITPNFFIQGEINNDLDVENPNLILDITRGKKGIESSSHFKNRLFDRDTLFVHYYKINFLYVLKAYSEKNQTKLDKFKNDCKRHFRTDIINYLNNSSYKFYYKEFETAELLIQFVSQNFKLLNGRCYRSESKPLKLIIADSLDNEHIILLIRSHLFEKMRLL